MPADGATGIAADARIFVTFSEPMDPATVAAAYASTDLPLDAVSLAWSPDNTVLTISPDAGLAYAEGVGTDPDAVTARTYTVTIGAGAADYAGNPLTDATTLTFATRRRLSTSVPLDGDLTRVALGGSLLGSSNDVWVGDNAVDNTYRAYLTFDLATMPADVDVEAASFSARQLAPIGAPYNLGAVMVQQISFATFTGFDQLPALSLPGALSMDGTAESKSIDVTSQVGDDLAHRSERGDHSQYRLQIDQATNNDATTDRAVFALGTFEMTIQYVAP